MITQDELRDVVRAELSTHIPPRLVSVPSAARSLGLAESAMWKLVAANEIRSLKIGRRRLIPVEAIDEFVAQAVA